jgi:hypothetical protein
MIKLPDSKYKLASQRSTPWLDGLVHLPYVRQGLGSLSDPIVIATVVTVTADGSGGVLRMLKLGCSPKRVVD